MMHRYGGPNHRFMVLAGGAIAVCMVATIAAASHSRLHIRACGEPDSVGGGSLGNSPGAGSLGWDVGSGQCNGSFVVTREDAFQTASDALELGLRVEQRRVGQIALRDDNVYFVETGADVTAPLAGNRAWWNFQVSTAYDGVGGITSLESLVLTIETLAGPNLPSAPSFDLLALRQFVDARNGGGTAEYADIFQMSQNPEFGWFAATVDGDANPSSFDYDAEGIWRFTLEARGAAGALSSVSMCVRTRGAAPLDNGESPCEVLKSGKSKKSKKSRKR